MQAVIETEPIRETQGDDWIWPFALLDENDDPIDLTGVSFDGAAIKWDGGALPLSLANGRLAVEAAAGAITVMVARADAVAIPAHQRSRMVLPIVDTQDRKSTLLIIPVQIRVP
ncbi:MAG: hypothetical protein AB1490_10900 [Pseudomonadota bacterium]